MSLPQVKLAYLRSVRASEAILAQDGDEAAHAERVAALDRVFFDPNGLDVGQVSRPVEHGVPNDRQPSNPGRDSHTLSEATIAFLKRERLV